MAARASKKTRKRVSVGGTIRKVSHASSTNKKRQATRDSKNIKIEVVADKKEKATKKTTSKKAVKKMRYVGVEKSAALDTYVRRQCNGLLRRISIKPNKYKLKFRIKPEARKSDHSIKSFSVEGVIVITGRKELRAKAKMADAKAAVDSVIKALESKVRRETEKMERSRKTMGQSLKPVKEYRWEMTLDSK